MSLRPKRARPRALSRGWKTITNCHLRLVATEVKPNFARGL
jgi:hypothetical protein